MIQTGYAGTRHGQLHYRSAGDGEPLLLLHATPRSSRAFARLIPCLARRFRVIAPDTLGFGRSAPLPADVTIAMLADSLADLLDALGIATAAVFGLHTGNKIGAALAAAYPERVSRLLICGMTHSIIPDGRRREAAIRAILDANPIMPEDIADPAERRDRQEGAAGSAAIYQANYAFDLAATLGQVEVPTLVIELVTAAEAHLGEQGPALARLTPSGAATRLDMSDRDALERQPEALAAVISRFLT